MNGVSKHKSHAEACSYSCICGFDIYRRHADSISQWKLLIYDFKINVCSNVVVLVWAIKRHLISEWNANIYFLICENM